MGSPEDMCFTASSRSISCIRCGRSSASRATIHRSPASISVGRARIRVDFSAARVVDWRHSVCSHRATIVEALRRSGRYLLEKATNSGMRYRFVAGLSVVVLAAALSANAGQRSGGPGVRRAPSRPPANAGVIIGHVVDANTNAPVRRAQIQATNDGAYVDATSDDEGRF